MVKTKKIDRRSAVVAVILMMTGQAQGLAGMNFTVFGNLSARFLGFGKASSKIKGTPWNLGDAEKWKNALESDPMYNAIYGTPKADAGNKSVAIQSKVVLPQPKFGQALGIGQVNIPTAPQANGEAPQAPHGGSQDGTGDQPEAPQQAIQDDDGSGGGLGSSDVPLVPPPAIPPLPTDSTYTPPTGTVAEPCLPGFPVLASRTASSPDLQTNYVPVDEMLNTTDSGGDPSYVARVTALTNPTGDQLAQTTLESARDKLTDENFGIFAPITGDGNGGEVTKAVSKLVQGITYLVPSDQPEQVNGYTVTYTAAAGDAVLALPGIDETSVNSLSDKLVYTDRDETDGHNVPGLLTIAQTIDAAEGASQGVYAATLNTIKDTAQDYKVQEIYAQREVYSWSKALQSITQMLGLSTGSDISYGASTTETEKDYDMKMVDGKMLDLSLGFSLTMPLNSIFSLGVWGKAGWTNSEYTFTDTIPYTLSSSFYGALGVVVGLLEFLQVRVGLALFNSSLKYQASDDLKSNMDRVTSLAKDLQTAKTAQLQGVSKFQKDASTVSSNNNISPNSSKFNLTDVASDYNDNRSADALSTQFVMEFVVCIPIGNGFAATITAGMNACLGNLTFSGVGQNKTDLKVTPPVSPTIGLGLCYNV